MARPVFLSILIIITIGVGCLADQELYIYEHTNFNGLHEGGGKQDGESAIVTASCTCRNIPHNFYNRVSSLMPTDCVTIFTEPNCSGKSETLETIQTSRSRNFNECFADLRKCQMNDIIKSMKLCHD